MGNLIMSGYLLPPPYTAPRTSLHKNFKSSRTPHSAHSHSLRRYSEDIDLVQLRPGPIGPAVDAIRKCLDPWLGEPRRGRKENRFTLIYRFESEISPVRPMRLKVEVNNDENFSVFELQKKPLEARSIWFKDKGCHHPCLHNHFPKFGSFS